jgi:plastocyanin
MQSSFARFARSSRLRWSAAVGVAAALAVQALPATAQPEVQTGAIAATPPNCVIQMSVANPNPGDQEIPRSLVMSGTAHDGTAPSGTGISSISAFLGSRDAGGTFVGATDFPPSATLPGAWSLTATLPSNISGGQQMFVYGTSAVSGQEASVSIPIVVGELPTSIVVTDVAQSVCPAVMPTIAPTAQPVATAIPTVVPPAQPVATAIPTVVPTAQPAAPANPPVAAPPATPAPVQLSISSPNSPPLTFDTTTLSASPGAQVTVTYTNDEIGVAHNWHLFDGPDSSAPSIAATQIMPGPAAVDTVTFTAPTQSGSYFFWCDVHPTIMTGNLVVGTP